MTMPGIFAFCRCVGEAVLAKGARGLAGLVPLGDHLYDIAATFYGRYEQWRLAETPMNPRKLTPQRTK